MLGIAAVLFAAAPRAEAQVKPFKVNGGGLAPNGISGVPGVAAPHSAIGEGNELGKYYCEGFFKITGAAPVPNPLQASFSSAPYFTFVADNGDQLVVTYGKSGTGLVTLPPIDPVTFSARFVAEFNPVPEKCTGRFKGVTGSWIMIARARRSRSFPPPTQARLRTRGKGKAR